MGFVANGFSLSCVGLKIVRMCINTVFVWYYLYYINGRCVRRILLLWLALVPNTFAPNHTSARAFSIVLYRIVLCVVYHTPWVLFNNNNNNNLLYWYCVDNGEQPWLGGLRCCVLLSSAPSPRQQRKKRFTLRVQFIRGTERLERAHLGWKSVVVSLHTRFIPPVLP